MSKTTTILLVVIVAGLGYIFFSSDRAEAPAEESGDTAQEQTADTANNEGTGAVPESAVSVTPISHATMVLRWGDTVIYTDPVGGAEAFAGQPSPDLILMTDVHGDHLSAETLEAVTAADTTILAPQAVADELSTSLLERTTVIGNGERTEQFGIMIDAIPMYNLPEQGVEIRHEMGRGNGYVLEGNGTRVYIAGDTADIPEMRALTDIDIAFVPMNLPYTMGPERAADGVIDFAPAQVYPYHYRTPEGFSDVGRFAELVREGDPNIEVVQLDWYPDTEGSEG